MHYITPLYPLQLSTGGMTWEGNYEIIRKYERKAFSQRDSGAQMESKDHSNQWAV
jgi:hypothetical protein